MVEAHADQLIHVCAQMSGVLTEPSGDGQISLLSDGFQIYFNFIRFMYGQQQNYYNK